MTTQRPQPLLGNDLDILSNTLQTFVTSVLDDKPALKNDKAFVDELVDSAINFLSKEAERDGKDFISRDQIANPEFIKEFSLCIMIGATLEDNKDLNKELTNVFDTLLNNKPFMEELKNLLNPENPEPKKGQALEDLLKKHFKPEQIQQLKKGLDAFSQKMHQEMKNSFKAVEPSKDMEKSASNDMYTNLFGLLNSAIAGAHPIPLQSYMGNGLGFNDWNPYDGSAPIDSQNSIKDYQFGDSLGLNANTVRNYSMIPDTMVDSFQSLLDDAGLAPSTAPRPGMH